MTEAGAFTIDSDHPALPGHFPGTPVVPGVVLLDQATSLILDAHPGHRLTGMPQVKFLRPVRPGEPVHVSYGPTLPRIVFACRVGDQEAVRGTLTLDPAA